MGTAYDWIHQHYGIPHASICINMIKFLHDQNDHPNLKRIYVDAINANFHVYRIAWVCRNRLIKL